MGWRKLTEKQWEKIKPHLPKRSRSKKGGRPNNDDRKSFEGILWILWTGAPWSELPRRYGGSSTVWRRLRDWRSDGTLLNLWRAFRGAQRARPNKWDECLLMAPLLQQKKGQSRQNQEGKGFEAHGFGRWQRYSARNSRGLGVPGGSKATQNNNG
ncbi:MAG: transposase [Bdellovibrionales bacterium]|nr:transposase [Bdellovibrionales bacterium]